MKGHEHQNYSAARTFEFGSDLFPETTCVFWAGVFPLVHTVVEFFQHERLENDYPNCPQGARSVLAQHMDHGIQHGIRHLPCLYFALT